MQILEHHSRNENLRQPPTLEAWRTIKDIERILKKVSSLKMDPTFSEINGYILPDISKTRDLDVETCMNRNPKETQTVYKASTASTSVTGVSTAVDIAKVSASTFTVTEEESEEEALSEQSLPCYVVPVLYRPEKTSSPTHIKTVGRNLQMPFSKSFQVELEKKLEERKTLQELSFPYTRKFEKGKITNDFVVYPLSEGSHMVKKSDEHRQVKSVQTSMNSESHPSDYITDISHETGRRSIVPFKKYVKAIENNLRIQEKPSSVTTGDDTDIDLQEEEIEEVQHKMDYYSCIGNSRSSILRDITDILSPSEQSIYRRTSDLGEIIEKRNRLLSLHTLHESSRGDEQVQVGISVSTIETMTESTQRSTSMQTTSSCILGEASNESIEKITQTAMKNIERILVMLPREKAVRVVTRGTTGRETSVREMGDEALEERVRKSSLKMPDTPRSYPKTVRIDPKFFQNNNL